MRSTHGPPLRARAWSSEFKLSQCALQETLTVSLALFGHIDDFLRECLPSTIGMTINPEGGFISLNYLPSIVQRAAQNGNGLGVERYGIVLEIPEASSRSPLWGGSTTGLSAIDARG
jgi:hypothetical protein